MHPTRWCILAWNLLGGKIEYPTYCPRKYENRYRHVSFLLWSLVLENVSNSAIDACSHSRPVDPRRSRGCSPAGVARKRRKSGVAGFRRDCVGREAPLRREWKALGAARNDRLAMFRKQWVTIVQWRRNEVREELEFFGHQPLHATARHSLAE